MFIRRFRDFNDLLPYQEVWRSFAIQTPCGDWDWCRSWWEAYQRHRDLYVLVGFRDESLSEVQAIAPWCLESSAARGRRITQAG